MASLETNHVVENYREQMDRYHGMISAIEFFSGRFDVEQIIEYADEFIHKLLPAKRSLVWCLDNHKMYVPKIQVGFDTEFCFEHNDGYDQVVHFHAGLLYPDAIKKYFPKEVYEETCDFAVSLAMDKTLYGIILVQLEDGLEITSDDVIIAEALMNLFATALTNYKGYMDLKQIQIQLDEKIFNLFAVNQSTKALLSETNLDDLYKLSIGVFAELTQSVYTTFFIFDDKSELFKLKGARHVFDTKRNDIEIHLFMNKDNVGTLPVLLDASNDADIQAFTSYFFNGDEVLQKISPKYIVVLKKFNEIVGFVTLGEKVNGNAYDQSIFELIESLASSTYIAIINGMYIERINEQKALINRKLEELIRLNALMKNINRAKDCEQVYELVMKTLEINFGITLGFIASWNDGEQQFEMDCGINMKQQHLKWPRVEKMDVLFQGECVILHDEASVRTLLEHMVGDVFEMAPQGLVILPIYYEDEENEENEVQMLSVILLLASKDGVLASEENLVKFEAITTHLAPVLYQLQSMEQIKKTYKQDNVQLFQEGLERQMDEANRFQLDLYVLSMKALRKTLFGTHEALEELRDKYPYVYPLDGEYVFLMCNTQSKVDEVVMLYDRFYDIETYQYQKDFNDRADFIALFEA